MYVFFPYYARPPWAGGAVVKLIPYKPNSCLGKLFSGLKSVKYA